MTARGKWIPASAGMTAIEHPRCHSCGSRNPLSDFQTMDSRVRGNDSKSRRQTLRCHSCGSRNPLSSKQWIPAFAGMTARGQMDSRVRGNDSKGQMDSRFRGNDRHRTP
ncbi:hypothetical protein QUF72_04295, partial [Desulfobacterales bacterium HSG2]|nr:hypothetical protein [Desulfobacterales bacterium HSG2]